VIYNYKTFMGLNTIRNTFLLNNENDNCLHYVTENYGMQLYMENNNTIFQCTKDNIKKYLRKYTNINHKDICAINKFLTSSCNDKKISEQKLISISKTIKEKIEKTINVKFDIQLSLEEVEIKKFIYNSLRQHNVKDNYCIVTYSISKCNRMLISDFMVFNSVNDIDIDKISNIIMNEITWSLSKKIQLNSTKNFDIILKNTAAGMFFHECIGHFLEADHYYNSPIRLLKDNKFCSRNITIIENLEYNYDVDDYGSNVCNSIQLIKDGYINNVLSNEVYSNLLGIKNTGNGITENTYMYPFIRMRNMKLLEKPNNIEELISNTDKGILIEKISMGEVNVYTGDFSILVTKSYIINNGVIKEELDEFVLNYNIRQLIEADMEVCNDIESCMSLCGKFGVVVKVNYCTPSVCIKWPKKVGV